jgi:hypothetical protein
MLVRYEDFCEAPGAILRQVLDHTGCTLGDEELNRIEAVISAPSYYRLPFGDSEAKKIASITRDVAEKFGVCI